MLLIVLVKSKLRTIESLSTQARYLHGRILGSAPSRRPREILDLLISRLTTTPGYMLRLRG